MVIKDLNRVVICSIIGRFVFLDDDVMVFSEYNQHFEIQQNIDRG